MVRGWSIALGVGLILLWIAGLSAPSPGWLAWLDGLAGLFAFIIAGMNFPLVKRSVRTGGPIALAVGLFVMWVAGMATGAPTWLAWWNFAFACAFLLVGISAGVAAPSMIEHRAGETRRTIEEQGTRDARERREREELERRRRSA
jgi:thiol:disulfide interchange protein